MGEVEAENVRRLELMYDAFKTGDMETILGIIDDEMDLEVVGPSTVPFAGRFRGRAAIEEFFAIVAEHTDRHPADPTPIVHEMIAEGDKVVAMGVDRVRSKATGAHYDGWWIHVIEMRAGKIVRLREFMDTAAAHAMFQGLPIANGVHKRQ
jgi:ketosteroid isomerase-like protein